MTNEAVKRLDPNGEPYPEWLDEALAYEYQRGMADGMAYHSALAARTRRATVERIREALGDGDEFADALNTAGALRRRIHAILDEEAAR